MDLKSLRLASFSPPLWPLVLFNNPDNDSERLTAIILQGERRDHMQIRLARRMPVFVAKKSQYRNCQSRERVAFSHGCAGGGEAEISILRSRSSELAQRRRKLFKMN
jgi:hypothetical protein